MSRLISAKLTPVEPITEPVTLSEAKEYLKIDFSEDDTLISSLIVSSRRKCEQMLGLCLVETKVKALYKNGGDLVELAYGPITTDVDGLPIIDGLSEGVEIKGDGNQIWVSTTEKELNLSYTSKMDPMPDWAKQAILNDVAFFYESRGDRYMKGSNEIAPQTMNILFPHRTTLHEFLL